MDKIYALLTSLVAPLVPLWLAWRRARGKEDGSRLYERFGIASTQRPVGTLVWLHAASVGEANSILVLIGKLRERFPELRLLLTTGTVTSAQLMQRRLPKGAIHQYVPVDTPEATGKFMRHWKPDIALWVESEFWPNLVRTADEWECFMGVINARMSERSFAFWKKYPSLIVSMLSRFNVAFAQSEADQQRLESLGAKQVSCVGNLKYDATLLPCDEGALLALKTATGERPIWLAASTHPGEEELIAHAHKMLSATRRGLLTVIVPRHPERGAAIAAELGKQFNVSLRSRKNTIGADTAIYIADTLGELGLFYRLCEIVFMGGSLVDHGGQNPLEPARLACAVVAGIHTQNFRDIYLEMERTRGCLRVKNADDLAAQIDMLLNHPSATQALQSQARQWVEGKSGATDKLLDELAPIFAPRKKP